MWKKTFLIIGLTALMIVHTNAQSMSLGPQLGYYKARDADQGNVMVGITWRLKLMPVLGVEASINYRQDNYADNALTVRSWPVIVTGLIYPLQIVYGAIGFGWYNLTYDYDQNKLPLFKDETTQKIGWHFGGGAELPIGLNITCTCDIRYVFLNYDFKTISGSGDLNSNFAIITFGLLFGL